MRHALLCLAVVAAAPVLTQADEWFVSEKKDEMTDELMTGLVVSGSASDQALAISCESGRVSVMVAWGNIIPGDDTDILERLDANPAKSRRWAVSEGNRHTSINHANDAKEWVLSIANAERLLLRAVPYGDKGFETASFPVAGLAARLKKVPCFMDPPAPPSPAPPAR